jgi:hypothetical protein
MFRTNLFRCLSIAFLALSCSAAAFAQHQNGYMQMPGVHIPQSQYQAPIVDYYSGQTPRVFDSQQPVERFLGELTKRSWMRFQYLHWDFDDAGSGSIGAPVLNLSPIDPLTVFDNQNGGISTGVGVIPTIDGLGNSDNSGARGTWGLDLNGADFELEFFGTKKNSFESTKTNISGFRPVTIDPISLEVTGAEIGTVTRPNIVIPLLSSGAPAQANAANYLIFDSSFSTNITSQIWGAEATLLSETYIPDSGFSWQWLGGFRYVNYDEQFGLRGVFNDGGAMADEVTQLTAKTQNNMYGPEAGFRAQVNHQYFTFSATPRVAMTLNNYRAKTTVNSLRGNLTPTGGEESGVDFTPVVQVSFLGELHLNENFSMYGGYDFMWIYRMTRPYDNLQYLSSPGVAGATVPDIAQQVDHESFALEGLTFGCVFRY